MGDAEDSGGRMPPVQVRIAELGCEAEALLKQLERRALVQAMGGTDEEAVVAAVIELQPR